MIRALTVLLLICATVVCAGCSSLAILRQRSEYRGFLEDWGVNKPRKVWIYAPMLGVALGCLFLASCSMGPTDFSRTVARADGSTSETKFTTAGVSILTRNAYEDATVSKGEFQASHKVYGKDEVAVPRYSAWGDVGVAGANALEGVTETVVEGVTQ